MRERESQCALRAKDKFTLREFQNNDQKIGEK